MGFLNFVQNLVSRTTRNIKDAYKEEVSKKPKTSAERIAGDVGLNEYKKRKKIEKDIGKYFLEALKTQKDREERFTKQLYEEIKVSKYRITKANDRVVASFDTDDETYIENEVKLLFVSEYKTEDVSGALLCWDAYDQNTIGTTHYEVWRRDFFEPDSQYEKVGIGYTVEQLKKERDGAGRNPGVIPYIREALNLQDRTDKVNSFFYFLDLGIEKDRIYGYKVNAISFPTSPVINYELLMRQSGKITKGDASTYPNMGLTGVSVKLFNDERLAWIISLVNNNILYFGNSSKTTIVTTGEGGSQINIPNDLSYIGDILQESINLFGAKRTYSNILTTIGGLSSDIFDLAIKSIDEGNSTFSFDDFKERVRSNWAFFDLTLKALSTTKTQDQVEAILGIDFPPQEGSIDISDIVGATIAIDFIERVFSILISGEDRDTLRNLQDFTVKQSQRVIEEKTNDYIDSAYGDALEKIGIEELSREGIDAAVKNASYDTLQELHNFIDFDDFEGGASEI